LAARHTHRFDAEFKAARRGLLPLAHHLATPDLQHELAFATRGEACMDVRDQLPLRNAKHAGEPLGEHRRGAALAAEHPLEGDGSWRITAGV
jgi:hypothetical protein